MASPPEFREFQPTGLSERMVRNQLERILASDIFSRSGRLSAFLRFAVHEALAGRGDTLKEQVIALEIYGKQPGSPVDDDTAIVRVEARRLRDKLREFYSQHNREPVIITLPKGTYAPAFEQNTAAIPSLAPFPAKSETVSTHQRGPFAKGLRRWAPAVAALILLSALMGWRLTLQSLSSQVVLL